MKKCLCNLFFAYLVLVLSTTVQAQLGIGTNTPNASAQLDVSSTSKGFLPPRLTYSQKIAIASPAAGLIIYCSNCGANGEIQFYNGINWMNISGTSAAAPLDPTIAPTSTASNVKAYNATSGGNITAEGGLPILARGICWSTSTAPTVALSTKTVVAGTTGVFTSIMSGLNPSTAYYVRSYATTAAGTVYGAETNFTTGVLTANIFGFESATGFPVTDDGTVWNSDGAWNDIRDYNGTVYAGQYSWIVGFNSANDVAILTNTYDFDATSIQVLQDGMSTATTLTIKCYDANNQQVGATIVSSLNSGSYSQVNINRTRIRKIEFSQNGTGGFFGGGETFYFDNLSYSH